MSIVETTVEDAATEARGAYPSRAASLGNFIRTRVVGSWTLRSASGAQIRGVVQNRSPLSHLYEYGTVARHTAIGADKGAESAHAVFEPIMIDHRRQMVTELIALLERQGFQVTGSPTDI